MSPRDMGVLLFGDVVAPVVLIVAAASLAVFAVWSLIDSRR